MESRQLNVRTASERADEDDEKVKEQVREEWIDDSGGEFWGGGRCTRCSNFKLSSVTHLIISLFPLIFTAVQFIVPITFSKSFSYTHFLSEPCISQLLSPNQPFMSFQSLIFNHYCKFLLPTNIHTGLTKSLG